MLAGQMRYALRELASLGAKIRTNPSEAIWDLYAEYSANLDKEGYVALPDIIKAQPRISIAPDGSIDILPAQLDAWDLFRTALQSIGNVARLRRCQVCSEDADLFIARRKDQRACSTKHTNVLKQREWYARHRAPPADE